MTIRPFILAAALAFPALTAAAGETAPLPLTYEKFEVSVPHTDLARCPAALAAGDRFCRATLRHEELHVFVFSKHGDSPLVGFASFPADGLPDLLER